MKRMPRRIFTEEFKKEAVRLFKEQGLLNAFVGMPGSPLIGTLSEATAPSAAAVPEPETYGMMY
jgi:transposase-like protein